MALPTKLDMLFGESPTSAKLSKAEVSERFDELMKSIDAMPTRTLMREEIVMNLGQGRPVDFDAHAGTAYSALSDALTPEMRKSLSPEALASIASALDELKTQQPELTKDITLTSPVSTGLVAFDLEGPAKMLTPRPTPLRNRIPRTKGIGTSRRFKVISGFTGTGTGGVGNIHPGIVDTTQNSFAPSGSSNALYYARGPKISYAGYDMILPYSQFSMSDEVTWSAQYQGQGYQDIRQLSRTSLLYASMLMEERMLLMGRGTSANNYSGAMAAPTSIAVTFQSPGTGQAALSGITTSQYLWVVVTSDAGGVAGQGFGQSVATTAVATSAVFSAGQNAYVTLTDSTSALGYNVYVAVSTSGVSAPSNSSFWLMGHWPGLDANGKIILQGAIPTSGSNPPTADTSAYTAGYDGILAWTMGSNSGYNVKINSGFNTANPGVEFQNAFTSLYGSVKADPDRILFNGADRKQQSDALKAGTANNYFLQVQQDEIGGVTLGSVAVAIMNETTGKRVEMEVHPWMPQGVAPIISDTLPIPDTQVSHVWEVVNVQELMGIDWPVLQFAYESSSYWLGTMLCYAPGWNGCVSGISYVGQL